MAALEFLWKQGKPGGAAHPGDDLRAIPGDVIVNIDSELGIGASPLGDGRFILHAYASTERLPWTKVFSVQVVARWNGASLSPASVLPSRASSHA